MDWTNQKDILEAVKSVKTDDDWNEICDQVKHANGGDYPSFWWMAIAIKYNTEIQITTD